MPPLDFKDFQEKLSTHFRPFHRSFQFWVRAVDIYTGYKVLFCAKQLFYLICLSEDCIGYLFIYTCIFGFFFGLGVSTSGEFREGCEEAGGNVGGATRTCS